MREPEDGAGLVRCVERLRLPMRPTEHAGDHLLGPYRIARDQRIHRELPAVRAAAQIADRGRVGVDENDRGLHEAVPSLG